MSRYRLFRSNRLKSFIEEYGSILRGGGLFGEKTLIVVQNRSIGEWLKLELADKFGISANLSILLPENAVRSFVRSFPLGRDLLGDSSPEGERAVLFMDNLKIIIYKKLEELLHAGEKDGGLAGSVYAGLENYVKGLAAEESDYRSVNSLRLYQLSDSIAGLFYYYGMNCRDLTAAWEKGQPFFSPHTDSSIISHEKWQMALWRELFNDKSPYVHLSSILSAIVDREDVYDGAQMRVVLFGSAFLGDSSLRFFRHLSRFTAVDHFSLSPTAAKDDFVSPLLLSWGGLFDGFRSLMAGLAEQGEESFDSFSGNKGGTLLAEIQNSLLNNRVSVEKIRISREDRSLSIISTTGKWRETEALKNRLLRLLDEDPGLKLTDIGVLAPDINEYAPFIEAVFPSEDSVSLPYNIIDLQGEGNSPFISGFLLLLDLAGSRFTRKDLFALFSNRCFAARQGISPEEYTSWLDLCDRTNIRWSMDSGHKRELHVAGDSHNSWERGFERILEGMALSEADDPEGAPFELFGENDNYSAGRLMHIVRSLYRDIDTLTGVRLLLEEWVLVWESLMDAWLRPSDGSERDDRDRLRLKGCFRDILNMVNDLGNLEYIPDRLFDFYMFKSLLTEFVSKSGGSLGRYLTQGISCASLKPLRAVPFKVIMVLGLNEESFPASDEALSFDLKETDAVKKIISIDLSRRSSDKYSFLEVFLSAREKVCLFYTGRNNVDNEILQPSSLLSELTAFIDNHFEMEGEEDCVRHLLETEKLQPFDKVYFSENSGLFSYSRKDSGLAGIYYGARREDEAADLEPLPDSADEEEVLEISFLDLAAFLKNPLKYFFNRSCGVFLDEAALPEEEIDEKVEPDFFIARDFYREILLSPMIDSSLEENLDRMISRFRTIESARGEIADSILSLPAIEALRDGALSLVKTLKDDVLLSSKPEPVRFTMGDKREMEKNLIESPVFRAGNGRKIRVTGTLPPLYLYRDGTVLYTDYLGGGNPSYRHWINPFLINLLLPSSVKGNRGIQARLAGKDRIHALEFPPGTAVEGEKLVNVFAANLRKPLPLYPEIGEKLALSDMGGADLVSSFQQLWTDLHTSRGDSASWSEFRSCPYKNKAYSGLPVPDARLLEDLLNSFYRLIRELGEAQK